MIKEEIKHLREILKAYLEGKTIQRRIVEGMDVTEWEDIDMNNISVLSFNGVEYRIKPEPKTRPYGSAEEFLEAQKKHGPYIILTDDSAILPIKVRNNGIEFREVGIVHNYREVLDYNRWQDGSPCGILE